MRSRCRYVLRLTHLYPIHFKKHSRRRRVFVGGGQTPPIVTPTESTICSSAEPTTIDATWWRTKTGYSLTDVRVIVGAIRNVCNQNSVRVYFKLFVHNAGRQQTNVTLLSAAFVWYPVFNETTPMRRSRPPTVFLKVNRVYRGTIKSSRYNFIKN